MSKNTVPAEYENDVDFVITHGLRAGRMLTFSFIGATVMYVAVGALLAFGPREATTVLPWQQAGLLVAAVVAAVIALLWLPAKYTVERIVAKQNRVSAAEAVQHQMRGFAIGMAVIEVVSLLGLIATYLTANWQYVVTYAVYGTVMQLLLMARRGQTLQESRSALEQLAQTESPV